MSVEINLSGVVSGSFAKFKPEIDLAIDEFRDLGVNILAPEKGWLIRPVFRQYNVKNFKYFRPLPLEIGKTLKGVEDDYLTALSKSNFVYVVNPEGFIGNSVSLEIGFALGKNIPIYSEKPILSDADVDIELISLIATIKSITPKDLIMELRDKKNSASSKLI